MRYAVIGGGVLGLTAALRLGQQGHDVQVLEQHAVPGGLASSFEVEPGIWLERYYHHLFRTDRHAIALIDELGLSDRLRWHRPVTTLTVGTRPYQLDSPRSLLAFSPLPILDRLRMGAVIAALKLMPSPRRLERHTADRWMARWCGRRGHELVWRPLLEAKFRSSFDVVSMAWLWARIHDRSTELGYLDGGFHQVYAALADRLPASGGAITYGATVRSVRPEGDGLAVAWDGAAGEGSVSVDRVISTLSPVQTSRFADGAFDPAQLAAQRHAPLSAHCLILALDRPLTDTYWIGAVDPAWPFMAVVEHTAMLPPSAYGGHHLLYLGAYRPADDQLPQLEPAAQVRAADGLLRALNPAFDETWVTRAWSFTAPFAQPIVDTEYRARIPGFATRMPGLFTASMFQVYPHDRGQNYSVALAERLVRFLGRDPAQPAESAAAPGRAA